MEKILKTYIENQSQIQIFIREKTFEGVIESLQDDVVHLIGEKYEYHLPVEHNLRLERS